MHNVECERSALCIRHYALPRSQECDRLRGDSLAAAHGVNALVGFRLHADTIDANAEHTRERLTDGVDMSAELRRLEHHRDVDVPDFEALPGGHPHRPAQQVEAARVLPLRIGIGKVAADIAETRRAEHRVSGRVTDNIRVRVSQGAALRRNRDATEHERAPGYEPMEVVAEAGPPRPRGTG